MATLRGKQIQRPGEARKGNSIIEFVFLAPWYLFLFVGFFDMGLYNYALISAQAAARVAATYTSTNSTTATDSTTACRYALAQLRDLPNVPAYSPGTGCTGSSVSVTATLVTGPDGNPASLVTVTYVLPSLAGIPKLLPGQYTAVQSFEMKLQS
jgi:Flp pilus assembly protein TadG